MKLVVSTIVFILFTSCNSSTTADTHFKGKPTIIETLKEAFTYEINEPSNYDARYYMLRKHKDEILKSMEVVEAIQIPSLDVTLAFYRYSVGTDIVKDTRYFKKLDSLYFPFATYVSSYSDDPFKDQKPEEAKKLLKKIDEWSDNENIWYAD